MTCKVPHRNVLVAVAQCLVGFNSVAVAAIFTLTWHLVGVATWLRITLADNCLLQTLTIWPHCHLNGAAPCDQIQRKWRYKFRVTVLGVGCLCCHINYTCQNYFIFTFVCVSTFPISRLNIMLFKINAVYNCLAHQRQIHGSALGQVISICRALDIWTPWSSTLLR